MLGMSNKREFKRELKYAEEQLKQQKEYIKILKKALKRLTK